MDEVEGGESGGRGQEEIKLMDGGKRDK